MKIIIGLLLIFYALTFYIVLHPKVSEPYFNYYIANTTDLTKVDQDRLVNLKIGQIISADTNQIFFDRWIHTQPGARFSKGNHPAIIFSLNESEINLCKCLLELSIKPLWAQGVEILVNGNLHFNREMSEPESIQIKLDRNELKSGLNNITFNLKDAKKINFSDKYKSSIEFRALVLR